MTASERHHLEVETDLEFLENRMTDMLTRISELLSIEEVFVQDSRGVREAYSREQIRENRTLAAELHEDVLEYEDRISALRAESETMAHAA